MKHIKRQVDDGSITVDYARMEGIELVPEFDRERYKLPFVLDKLHPTFPEKGCTIKDKMMLSSRPVSLDHWQHLSEEWAMSDYYNNQLWEGRDLYFLDREHKLLCAVVDLEPNVIEAAFKKLAGQPSGGIYSHAALLFIGAALWRTEWCPVIKTDHSWTEYVAMRNAIYQRTRKAEEERQAAVLAFLDEVQ